LSRAIGPTRRIQIRTRASRALRPSCPLNTFVNWQIWLQRYGAKPEEGQKKMNSIASESDKSYNYTASHDRSTPKLATSSLQSYATSPKPAPRVSAWIANRAVQEVWEARVPVCRWSRPWPQTLSLREHAGSETRDDVCPTGLRGARRGISCKVQSCSRANGRDLRDQSRAFETPRRFLANDDGNRIHQPPWMYRSVHGRCFGGQYDSGFSSVGPGCGGNGG